MIFKKKIVNPLLFVLSFLLIFSSSCHNNAEKYKDMPVELVELSKQIDKHPKNDILYFKRADYYFNEKNFDSALADILKAIELNPDKSVYYILLSDIYFVQRETDLTEETLEKAIAKDSENNEARMKLAELYFHLNMLPDCYRVLDEAVAVKPHNPKAHLIRAFCSKEEKDTINYLRLLQLTIDQDPKEVKAFLELGYFYQQQLNPLALNYYSNALQVQPRNIEINYNLAKLYQDLNEWEKAEEQYKILLQIKPDHIGGLNNLGYLKLIHEENYDEAIAYFTKVLEIEPSFIPALCNRAIAFMEKKEYDYAEQDYRNCLALNPQYEEAIRGLNHLDKIKAGK